MAPRGKGKAAVESSRLTAPRTRAVKRDGTPNIYDELVAEATAREIQHAPDSGRPLKRRRVAPGNNSIDHREDSTSEIPDATVRKQPNTRHLQTIEVSDSDESEFEFEDVDLEAPAEDAPASEDEILDVTVPLDPQMTTPKRTAPRRKPATASEKSFRLLVHKFHLVCLLGHSMFVNSWCNDRRAQQSLKNLLDPTVVAWLTLGHQKSQFERNRWFLHGLQHALDLFKAAFEVDATGMSKAKWSVDRVDQDLHETEPMDRGDFIAAAKKLSGSQDTGNQLFCALLRSVRVRARLVCSLQPLPSGNTPSKGTTPRKSPKPVVYAMPPSFAGISSDDGSSEDPSVQSSKRIGKVPAARRRLGQPRFTSKQTQSQAASKSKRPPVRKLMYPVYWVEAFNAAHQKWVAIDPIITQSLNKPAQLEPPASYEHNQLHYVIAFEADGSGRDVTRRYAKAYNAKTRRNRVESTENGAQWWESALRVFRRRGQPSDSDQVEDAELIQKESQEGMPKNVQDFKDHPIYALERHLKRHEVIHPRKETGKANTGTNAKPRMESVFRRRDVLLCRSADKWYRLGREIKAGEIPLKYLVTKIARSAIDDERDGEPTKTTALYAASQTQLYVPPPVVRERIPRNAYGNLDVYVPSMVPAGGTHIRHEYANQAANILKIDHVNAVTGFTFKGRHGTAVVEGVVVASHYGEAMHTVIEGIQEQLTEDASMKRSLVALQVWKHFITGLRIRERLEEYAEGPEESDDDEELGSVRAMYDNNLAHGVADDDLPTAGQYSLAELSLPKKKKKAKANKPRNDVREDNISMEDFEDTDVVDAEDESDEFEQQYDDDDLGAGFLVEDGEENEPSPGGFFVEDPVASNYDDTLNGDHGGGFLPDTDEPGGFLPTADNEGGFLPRDDTEEPEPTSSHSIGGGFLANNEPAPNNIVSQDKTARKTQDATLIAMDGGDHFNATSRDTAVIPPVAVDDAIQSGNEKMQTKPVTVHRETQVQPPDGTLGDRAGANSEESDRGSLLSHDPDDDDAEPDWMESD